MGASTAPGVHVSARSCSICTHHRRDALDKLLLRGEQLKAVARRYSVSEDALGRHKKHMQLVSAKAAAVVDQKDLAYGSSLLAEIGRIRADAERLQIESERRQDVRGALRQQPAMAKIAKDTGFAQFYAELKAGIM